MAVSPTFPGVYVQEVPSGVRTIVGVGTSITVFIGEAKQGPMNRPSLCLSYSDFARSFSEDATVGDLPYYVRLFFLNGGTQCYVVRTANNPAASSVTLRDELNANDVLVLTAKDPGRAGDNVRAVVTYGSPQPESMFNIDLFRWDVQNGARVKTDLESWKNLSMNPASPVFAATFLTQNSKLVDAAVAAGAPAPVAGFSQSGRPVRHDGTDAVFQNAWTALIGNGGGTRRNRFQLSVDGSRFVEINLNQPILNVAALPTAGIQAAGGLQLEIENRVNAQFAAAGLNGVNVNATFEAGPAALHAPLADDQAGGATSLLRIASTGTGDIYIRPASGDDLAVPLMLGTEQGGLEVGAHAARRPAPNGISLRASNPVILAALGGTAQSAINQVTLEQFQPPPATGTVPVNVGLNLNTTAAGDSDFLDAIGGSPSGRRNGVREKLMAGAPANAFTNNVKAYTLGAGGLNIGTQVAGTVGSDGTPPTAADYDNVYTTVDRQVDLFNLMALAPSAMPAVPVQSLYGNASTFCERRRAFLLMDPPASWSTVQQATDPNTGVNALRLGLSKQYAAVFFPRVTIDDRGKKLDIGPAGAIAGLMARIDATRGVWKAPAGTEADLRGVVGLEHKFSDPENGVLNPKAVNTLRIFPNGIVNWGARTMDGDDDFGSEYKYIPIRRLALFMEESLYRGLKWVVFEPNDEPLWAQIRLNVGAFMHDLFRQGAFQGRTPRDAYFVKCDGETTTQSDRNRGMVNIWVGFAPLKPAEFVVLYLQQMAGQIET
ncbi:MAG: hypothetical protein DMF87_06380 [Acidobacteria bacterium]|nr:MAG: hypothetical protein DMF87_06380 [Acidobacteriota bacterium]